MHLQATGKPLGGSQYKAIMGHWINLSCCFLSAAGPINSAEECFSPLCASFIQSDATQVCSALTARLVISGPAAVGWSLIVSQNPCVLLQQSGLARTQHYCTKTSCAKAETWCKQLCPSFLQKMGDTKRKHYLFLKNRFLMTAWVPQVS